MNVDNHAQQPPRPPFYKKIFWLGNAGCRFVLDWARLYFTLRTEDSARRWQYRHLKRLIEHAWDNVPFYRQYWEASGFNPSMFRTLDDMRLIPVVDRNMLIAHRDEFIARGTDMSRMALITTGGTTGMPMEFYIDNYTARAKEQAHQMYAAWHVWGYRQGIDRCVTLRGARISPDLIEKGIFWKKSDRDRGIVMSSFHLLDANYEAYMEKIRETRPRFIRGYPSSVVALCRLMKAHDEHGIPGLKGVLCSSETIYDWQRNLVREVLGVEIYSSYGHTEKAVWAFERDGELLFPPRYGYAEFVDDDFNPIKEPGATGQILATGFGLDHFPLIRYMTDDIAEVGTPRPGFPQVARRILGRKQEFVIDRKDNCVPFTCADEVFWGLDDVVAYQYVQEEPGKLTIKIQTKEKFDESHAETISKMASDMFVDFDIKIENVADIPKTKAGKFRYLIQNIKI